MKFRIGAIALILSLSNAAFAADLFTGWGMNPREFKLGDPLESDAAIGGYPVWQGEGKWRITDIVKRTSNGSVGIPFGDLLAFQTENKQLVMAMYTSATIGGTDRNMFWTDDPCKREDLLFKHGNSASRSGFNCVTINHIVGYMSNPSGKSAEAVALIHEQGGLVPSTILRIDFRQTRGSQYYMMSLDINPEIVGFKPETGTSWGISPWNKLYAFNDPAKRKFIDDLGAWAVTLSQRMGDVINQKSNALAGIPSWRTVIGQATNMSTATTNKSKVTLD